MNKEPRFIDFQNTRDFLYQNSRTYNERLNTQILNLYFSTDQTSVDKQVISLSEPLTIDSTSEIILESIQLTTMNANTVDSNGNGSYFPIDTLGFVLDIEEFNIKAGSNIQGIRDKIYIPYLYYNYNSVSDVDFNAGSGLNYYHNSGPLKNNYICTINPKKINNLTLTLKRLKAHQSSGGHAFSSNQPTIVDVFNNDDYESEPSSGDGGDGGDIMLVFSITNLGNMYVNQDNVKNVFMNPQNNLMNIPNEYEQMMLKQKQEDEMKQYYNRRQ